MEVSTEKRLRIGILFNFHAGWMGGMVYIQNLIKMLDFLQEEDKPDLYLFYNPELVRFVGEINYPRLTSIEWKFPGVIKGYLGSWLTRRNAFVDGIIIKYDLNGVYPLQDYPVKTRAKTRIVSWYADLQHKYYPEFFTFRKILERNARIKLMLKNSGDLVVSSKEVAGDFIKFFNPSPAVKIHIFHFVSVVEDTDGVDIEDIKKKYSLPDKYFMISNQFHKHKNHRIVLKSMGLLKAKGLHPHLAFTGKFPDDSGSPYIMELRNLIEKSDLKKQISFLGVIPRIEQLALMKHSQAVIQPSLFEGWSTVIEDARSLQVPVVASSIPVNIEQLGTAARYFDPENEIQLAEILETFPERNQNDIFYDDYRNRVRNAAKVFIDIFKK